MEPILDLLRGFLEGVVDVWLWTKGQPWFWPAVAAVAVTILLKVALGQLGIRVKPVVLVVVTILVTLLAVGILNG